ncbi:hypothetical protein LRP30_21060 [Bradyrhizobium sp. C-145]|uniref:hypothetical protein n=1 Tax=Bradyrhizobium sp. C-145 TaxID=574727 RepID=UPI00201B4825|nr:hypothetical protein [Bradyrhizobium sp. C-145]UQR67590.1 hypothetical protein LRP30_21060 [Bradyrhizobium sp. C-145]
MKCRPAARIIAMSWGDFQPQASGLTLQLCQQPVAIMKVQPLCRAYGGKELQSISRIVAIAVGLRDQSFLLRQVLLTKIDVSLGHHEMLLQHRAVHLPV